MDILHFIEADPFIDCWPALLSVAFECCSLEDSLTFDDIGLHWGGEGVAG